MRYSLNYGWAALLCLGVALYPVLAVAQAPAATPAAVAADVNSWSSCAVAADCIVVGSVCPNFYWAINRKFVFANAARNAAEREVMDCAVSFQSRPAHLSCVQGQCQIPHNQASAVQIENNK